MVRCSGEWIGVQEKCFYFSNDPRNWTLSKRFCSSQRSELAQIDTQEEMVRKGESFPSFQNLSLYKERIKIKKLILNDNVCQCFKDNNYSNSYNIQRIPMK